MLIKHRNYVKHLKKLQDLASKSSVVNYLYNQDGPLKILVKCLESISESPEDDINSYISKAYSTLDSDEYNSDLNWLYNKMIITKTFEYLFAIGLIVTIPILLNLIYIPFIPSLFLIVSMITLTPLLALSGTYRSGNMNRLGQTKSDFELPETFNFTNEISIVKSVDEEDLEDFKIKKITKLHEVVTYPPMPSSELHNSFFAAKMCDDKDLHVAVQDEYTKLVAN